jgi:hypothetical protein
MTGARTPSGVPRPPRVKTGGRPVIDLAGLRYGKLLVVERTTKPATRSMSEPMGSWWVCECNCGARPTFSGARLRYGKTLHCGGTWHRR